VCSRVERPTADKNAIREQLKDKRNQLFEKYSKNPMNTRLAIEIKLIDDQIAELTAYRDRKSALD
jgi:hypothetical protein